MDKKSMIENYVRQAHERGAFTGTWLFAENGEIVSKGAVGWKDPEDTELILEDSVFDLASVSKQFTATAVMLLRRQGLLDFDDEITKFFPEIPFQGVTIRHLLHHIGGLPDYMEWYDKIAKEENKIPSNAYILRYLCESGDEAEFAPGEKWEYSNTGYCLLAQIVEKASGVKFEEFVQKNIFEPAGMTATRIYHRRMDPVTIDNLAYGMVLSLGSDKYMLADDDPDGSEVVTCDGANGDGLVHSNIFDLYAWDRALREEKVLTKEEQSLMYTPGKLNNGEVSGSEDDEDGNAYGFGWFVENDPELGLIVCHSGGWPGYSSWYERFIDADKVLIMLKCRDNLDECAYNTFYAGLKAIARGKEPEPIRSIEELAVQDPDKSGWEAFCGKYDFGEADFRIDEIFMKDEKLYAKASYHEQSYELRMFPLEENTFGIKDIDGDITFGDDGLTLWGEAHQKL